VKSPSRAGINRPPTHWAAILSIVIFLAGCERDDVKVYHVAKDDSAAPPPNQMAASDQNSAAQPQLQWTLPAGWSEKTPGQMRVASFTVAGTNGEIADVGVIPLPATGQEIQLVNMWRGQLQLSAATNDDSEAVAIGADSGKLFDIASDATLIDGKFRARILVAMLTSGGTSWFFKMTGEDSFVAAQKGNFLQFLKSVSFAENVPVSMSGTSLGNQNILVPNANTIVTGGMNSSGGDKPAWTIPAGWQEAPPSEFLVAKFIIAGEGDAKAQVNISQLAGEGGGFLANVNRWRGQLGLPPADASSFPHQNEPDLAGTTHGMVDFTGTDSKTGKPARLIGAIIPRNGETWFYKLMGDPQIVARQKDAFTKFVQSAKYPNAP
jgi:hypothetical protein